MRGLRCGDKVRHSLQPEGVADRAADGYRARLGGDLRSETGAATAISSTIDEVTFDLALLVAAWVCRQKITVRTRAIGDCPTDQARIGHTAAALLPVLQLLTGALEAGLAAPAAAAIFDRAISKPCVDALRLLVFRFAVVETKFLFAYRHAFFPCIEQQGFCITIDAESDRARE
jgi:hypothetical protein